MGHRHGTRGSDTPSVGVGRADGHASIPGKQTLVEQTYQAAQPALRTRSDVDSAHAKASRDGAPDREAPLWRELGAPAAPRTSEEAATLAVDAKGGGQPVDQGLAAEVGARTGADVRSARVHADPLSRAATGTMNARAFAYGSDVFLGPGESETDHALLAHELTHVAQQRGGAELPQRKVAVGAEGSAAEAHADSVAAAVASGAPLTQLLIDTGEPASGQMTKLQFIALLRPAIVGVVEQELGKIGAAAGCPYIERYFGKYSAQPANAGETLIRHWVPLARSARSASDLVPLILARVREAVRSWQSTGRLPADLAAADPEAAVDAVHPASVAGLEAELGAGSRVDSRVAARMTGVLGTDVTDAQLHTGPSAAAKAAEHGATALAVGGNIVMGANAPAPGTPIGDALLAHELAHTAQQKGAAADPVAREKPIGLEDEAAEANADKLTSLGEFAGRIGDVMRTGLQLQRCVDYERDPDLQSKLGLSLDIAPAPLDGKTFIVGQKIKLSIGQKVETPGHKVMVYHWSAIDARGNEMRDHGDTVEFQIFWPGTTTLKAEIGLPGENSTITTTVLERKVEAVRATSRAEELVVNASAPSDFKSFRANQDINLALLSPENKPSPGQAIMVNGTGANPVKVGAGAVSLQVAYPQDSVEPAGRTYRWYAHPLQSKDMPDKLGAATKVAIDGHDAYDLGPGRGASLSTDRKGVYVVTCQAFDGAAKAAESSWVQTVLDAREIEAVSDLKAQMIAVDSKANQFTKNAKGEPDLVSVTAFHVDATTGAETQLNMFIGKRTDGAISMINATPGLKLTEHRIEFTGSSTDDVLDDFKSHNKYPPGAIRFHVPATLPGIHGADRTITTTGETRLGAISGALGFGALVLSVAAIPFTGGASATATVLLLGASAAGIAAGAFSLADHLSNEQYTTGSIALDCLQIAASAVDLGVAVKALRSSPALVVANRAVRYAMWGNLGIQSVSAFLISIEALGQIEQILDDSSLSRSDKIAALTKLLATLIVTGALLVLSYKSLGEAKARMSEIFGAKGSALKDLDAAALGLVDDNVLRTLTSAQKEDLERLAAMIREDPALVTRLPGRKNVLGALKGCKTNEASELERRLFTQRLTEAGASGKNATRITEALKAGNVDSASANLLTDADLVRLKNADDALAKAKGKRDSDATKASDLAAAKTEMDGVTGVSAGGRDEMRAALAHYHGVVDPAFSADPVAALRAKFPKIPPGEMALLGTLDKDALLALESATESDVRKVIAQLKSNPGSDVGHLLKSLYYKQRKPARKEGDVYEPPTKVGDRIDAALDNLKAARERGFPFGFATKADFDKFVAGVKGALAKRSIPNGDVRIHGSALHSATPGDIDVAVIVDGPTFTKLGDRFKAASGSPKEAKTVVDDMNKGKIASSNFFGANEPAVAREVSGVGTSLDAQVSIIRAGSEFDLGPYLNK
jgi:hypothetical protein